MWINIVAQAPPPTPTLQPPVAAPLTVPEFEFWNVTDELLQLWNSSGAGTGIQYFLIAITVLVGLLVIVHYVRHIGGGDDS